MVDGALGARGAGVSADRIAFLGHATVLIELAGVRVLTDPLLRSRVLHLRRQVPPIPNSQFAHVDIVLISHLHHDHLDLPSLRLLGLGSALVVPRGAGAWLRRRGFTKVTELSVGDGVNIAGAQIVAVPAHHDGRRLAGPSADPLGYLVGDQRVVYFAGDTERFAGMSKLAPALEVALLPVAGWGPTLGPGHMGPLDAARALAALQPRIAIPVHWGSLLPLGLARRHRSRLGDPPRRFAEHAARLAPAVEVRILAPGDTTTL
ncbi:MAG TPA: MBL fold metallo-hydrolase [Solirubrobacteraceae bacterium]|nr:MBL fold metallo-hydrolase [Solirubrobacteraceae bacterium]